GHQWAGIGVTVAALDKAYFPAGLSITQNFLNDDQGNPMVVASIFGPAADGSSPGGFAVFANLENLIKSGLKKGTATGQVASVRWNHQVLGPDSNLDLN